MKSRLPVKKCQKDNIVSHVLKEFRITYADCMYRDMTNEQWEKAKKKRRLVWKSPHRLSLKDAVRCYGQMKTSYNEFHVGLLRNFQVAFNDYGIEITPAREYSVAVYFHVPDPGLRKQVEAYAHKWFMADEIWWTSEDTLRCWWD